MTPQRWDRVQTLFEAALEQPPAEREALLRRECGDDTALRQEVQSLLDADADANPLLDAGAATAIESPTEPPLVPGTKLGEYVIEEQLGSGGFGTVYRAIHPVIRKQAAIKVLHARHSASPEHAQRFVNEARAVNEIGHRNIIDIFGFGETDSGSLYFVMEYVDAPTLSEMVGDGRLPMSEALPILKGLAAALDAAHDQGVVHRDLKPDNVLVTRDADGTPVPKLLDFGIAKLRVDADGTAGATATGEVLGTPAYMSPEQIRGKPVDRRCDAYAFGAVAYRMVTGEPPFRGDTPFDTMVLHTQETPRPPSAIAAELPAQIDACLLSLLSKDPADRPVPLTPVVLRLEAGEPSEPRAARPKQGTGRAVWFAAAAAFAIGVGAIAVANRGSEDTSQQPAAQVPAVDPPAKTVDPQAPKPAPFAATITVQIEGPPRGTTVIGSDGRVLGTAPGPIELQRSTDPTTITFDKQGFEPVDETVIPNRDQSLRVDLASPRSKAKAGPTKRKPPRKSINPDLESPFPR